MMEYDFQDQAERFLAWFFKLPPGGSFKGAFKGWTDSKDFYPDDQSGIWDQVQRMLRGFPSAPPCPNGILMLEFPTIGPRALAAREGLR